MEKPRFNSIEEFLNAPFEPQSINSEEYKRGLRYEVLCECINMEMAWHSARLHEAGNDSKQGRVHFDAMMVLKKLRDSAHVCDESTINRAWRVLRNMEADRGLTTNRPEHYEQNVVIQSVDISEPVAAAS